MGMEQKKPIKQALFEIYDRKYKLLLVIPFIMLLLAFVQIGHQIYTTGDFIKKDVSLKGGVPVTIPLEKNLDAEQVERQISLQFPKNDVSVRTLRSAGSVAGIIVEADINGNDNEQVQSLLGGIRKAVGMDLEKTDY